MGHATRVLDIAGRLRHEENVIRLSCSGQGLGYIRAHWPDADVVECPPIDVEWTEQGSFASGAFLNHFPMLLRSFMRQVFFEAENVSKFEPTVAMSDSRLSAVLAAKANSVPVITILNQFKVNLPPRFRGNVMGELYERIAGDVLGLLWSLSEEVLLTDLPPPYTIGEANIAGTDVSNIVRYVGFTSPVKGKGEESLRRAREMVGLDGRPLVFFQISGPDATKGRFAEVAVRSAAELADRYKVVLSMGYLGGSGEPRQLAGGGLLYDWCPIKDELFELSDALVARSGHRTIGQCIDAGKPAVLVPIHNHSEQLGNAEKFQRLGLGMAIPQERLTAEMLAEAVVSCVSDPKYREKVEAVRRVSARFNGLESCVEAIESYR